MHLSRRRLLGTTSALAGAAALSSCGFTGSDDDSDGDGGTASGTLTFTTWGTESELAGFRSAIESFQKSSGATVKLNAVPYEQMFTNIDAQIQAGNPPDVFRVPYYTFGAYAGAGQLLDLSSHLESGFADRFTPQAWAAVQNSGSPFGVPHHTDTSVILYNQDLLSSAGIDAVPTTLDEAWTWQEFQQVAQQLRQALPDDTYPFAYNWQGNGVTRWLSWLFEADGRFLSDDLATAAIDSDAGRAAVEFTQGFFPAGLVPPNSSVKSTTYAADLWYGQTVAMTFGGAFLLPDTDATVDFEWGATFSPRDVRAGGDFGGNALVATKGADPELAAAFFAHVTDAEQMRDFCAGASLLPTRADLVEDGIDFDVRPDLSPVFVGQASTVQAQDSGQVASPSMSKIIAVLQDQLEAAFVGGQDVETTIAGLSDGIQQAVA
ncbi:sugar ABC transporter substrate-binding protein [Nocardioides anomalus]|uniref:Sugar ABC transporter substrate-binding protein n=1 Tax=Nocardioides anomalus TaxID=2712223 RepID=A0A6G6WG01_9ACTN|nr:sugar ABC transporter substrate-binding protein [Nocardioides anomalus]QIG44162.1 sugar ABC transporter substrate-binding protein [Nocardioides anomalus]